MRCSESLEVINILIFWLRLRSSLTESLHILVTMGKVSRKFESIETRSFKGLFGIISELQIILIKLKLFVVWLSLYIYGSLCKNPVMSFTFNFYRLGNLNTCEHICVCIWTVLPKVGSKVRESDLNLFTIPFGLLIASIGCL